MLLHETLKYPSLEKVVGLELDQTVTRISFGYLGTQPHFDDPRVEWWFGGASFFYHFTLGNCYHSPIFIYTAIFITFLKNIDAAKSLLMLPKDYFGTFDLVLLDMSETVMSMTVTEGLDIFAALALLLQPKGIIVKNEMYFRVLAELFPYAAQLVLPKIPVICSQAMAMASYENELLPNTPIWHPIEALLDATKPLEDPDSPRKFEL